ncbi:outer membrane lipoprotein carrier protein LolA [Chitinophaga horti]|uniref:Outer membrane lipoprotein carrier protein LolA n=1 Tax=Chitinophaga horti TaxID=2920382 RepID=A0ABY6J2K7_9BACT|nr:outer membrane lipoprotein carrier protein LolA [Chitinophaga horti]UYQ93890.1 outer membrane lipoprotein carrier protein LolA [Chitinophaga horti]
MRKWIWIIACLVSTAVQAQSTGFKPVANLEQFKQQFAKTAQQTKSIKSDFVQEKNLSLLSEKITSKGKFWFKKEDKVKMEYQQPSYYLVVINGKDIKTKDNKKEQRISAKSSKVFQQVSRITADCVQGNVLNNAGFSTKVFENAQYFQLEMTPVSKGIKEYFRKIVLWVDKKDYSVTKMQMQEQSGDDTLMTFVNKEVNVNIPDEVFAVK